jgi:hypothetical protein
VSLQLPGRDQVVPVAAAAGELHHAGEKWTFRPNLHAHPAIIDRDVWERVQATRSARGRQPKSQRLLSRLGVLRCAGCDGRMSIGDDWRGAKVYRCSTSHGDCPERSTIMADIADQVVWAEVRKAEAEADHAEAVLHGLVATLTGLEDVPGARERLLGARVEATQQRARAKRLASTNAALETVDATDPRLTLADRRGVIRRTIARAMVVRSAPGARGDGRITVEAFSE